MVTSRYRPISIYELAKRASFHLVSVGTRDSHVGRQNASFSKDFVDFQNDEILGRNEALHRTSANSILSLQEHYIWFFLSTEFQPTHNRSSNLQLH